MDVVEERVHEVERTKKKALVIITTKIGMGMWCLKEAMKAAKVELPIAKGRVMAIEERVAKAKADAIERDRKVVEDFQALDQYANKKLKFVAKSYNIRFTDYQIKVGEHYPNLDLNFLGDDVPLELSSSLMVVEFTIFCEQELRTMDKEATTHVSGPFH
ncbi:hypothetical protein COCNU_scaffold001929G000020 [Cocos nucifera]|nr:hypothetical protein [Cocos nucifera]